MIEKIDYLDGLPVKVQLLNIQYYPWHAHHDIQIIYILEGELKLKLTYTSYTLPKNSIHFIHSDDVHGFESLSGDNLVILLNINMEYFLEFFPNLDTQIFTTKVNENVSTYKQQVLLKSYIFSMISELHTKKTGYQVRTKDVAMNLMNALYRDFRGFTVNREERIFEHKISHDLLQMDRISRVVSFVYANYQYKLRLSSIASDENINVYYLSHLFQRFVGESFRDFVSMVRVEMSEIRLLSSDASISQIAQDIGFSNAKYYVEHFKSWFGYHPKEYRQIFAEKILGKAKPIITELPLDSIKETVDSYTCQFPICKESTDQVLTANINFQKPPLYQVDFFDDCRLFPDVIILATLIKKRSLQSKVEPTSLYYKTSSQSHCIELLKELIQNPDTPLEKICFSDSSHSANGMLAINGLKKPLYYLYCFLEELYPMIIDVTPSYVVSKQNDNIQILVFNESEISSTYIDFNFFNIKSSYKLTEKKLVASHSCIDYWCQLNFQSPITDIDYNHIEAMSAPQISFEIIPKTRNYMYHLSLAPQDITLLQLEKII